MKAIPGSILAILAIHCVFDFEDQLSIAQTLDDKFSLNQIKALEQLCPRVDICIRNVSEPVVSRNRILEDGEYVSICHACSCHEHCDEMLNCCFPDANLTIDVDSVSTPPVKSDSSENGENTPGSDVGDSVDLEKSDERVPGKRPTSIKECLYSQTGVPDKYWVRDVPAYRIVSRAPPGGCKTDVPMDRATGEDPCGSGPVAPWGDLYPVIPTDHGTIYKNDRCARCHGARDFDHMDALLVCENEQRGRFMSVLDHFTFLKHNRLPSFCFIAFDYNDRAMLQDNRCFVDTVASCPISYNDDTFIIPDGVNITHTEVRKACHSGLNAPVLIRKAYQNSFCAVCNGAVPNLHFLRFFYGSFEGKEFGDRRATYLLDTSFLKENDNLDEGAGMLAPHPEVCLHDGALWDEGSCRELFCPSGQIRDRAGVCKYPSHTWYTKSFGFIVKLTSENINVSAKDILGEGNSISDGVAETFLETSPWPTQWQLVRILKPIYDAGASPMVAVELEADITNPSAVFYTLRMAMGRYWVLPVNGIDIPFEQAILEYTFTSAPGLLVPQWQNFANLADPATVVLNDSFTSWRSAHTFKYMHPLAYRPSKLFICESISLLYGEYTLLANNLALMNNLTGRVMFDKEFELVESENGRLTPRVCVFDTPLLFRSGSTATRALSGIALHVAIYMLTHCVLACYFII